jgi:hypothetical protein
MTDYAIELKLEVIAGLVIKHLNANAMINKIKTNPVKRLVIYLVLYLIFLLSVSGILV